MTRPYDKNRDDCTDLVEVTVRHPDTGHYMTLDGLTDDHAEWIARYLADRMTTETYRALIAALKAWDS